jgi:hypothetical protein
MSKTKCLLAMVALLAAMGTVSAQETAPKWGYIEAGYIDFSPDELDSDDGFFAGGSIPLFKMFHIVAEYNEVGDFSFWDAGFGWHGLLGDPLDLFAEVRWTDVEFDSGSNDVSDDGYRFAGGLRWMLGGRFELKGTVTQIELDQSDSDTTFEAEALFFLMENRLGIGASYETGDADTARAFARWNFGK